MILIDVNVLIYAHRPESPDHERYRDRVQAVIAGEQYGVADMILSSFLRMVTNRRIYKQPTPLELALQFTADFRSGRGATRIEPGPLLWDRFTTICRAVGATGNLVPDAFLAAMAQDAGCEWITTDRDFNRFPDVRWRHPLD
jgi:toxin-antitoxin system PIN domain toxin